MQLHIKLVLAIFLQSQHPRSHPKTRSLPSTIPPLKPTEYQTHLAQFHKSSRHIPANGRLFKPKRAKQLYQENVCQVVVELNEHWFSLLWFMGGATKWRESNCRFTNSAGEANFINNFKKHITEIEEIAVLEHS
ncbi:MAG: hypothetical protein ACYTXA_00700 [Nostoc sp.]